MPLTPATITDACTGEDILAIARNGLGAHMLRTLAETFISCIPNEADDREAEVVESFKRAFIASSPANIFNYRSFVQNIALDIGQKYITDFDAKNLRLASLAIGAAKSKKINWQTSTVTLATDTVGELLLRNEAIAPSAVGTLSAAILKELKDDKNLIKAGTFNSNVITAIVRYAALLIEANPDLLSYMEKAKTGEAIGKALKDKLAQGAGQVAPNEVLEKINTVLTAPAIKQGKKISYDNRLQEITRKASLGADVLTGFEDKIIAGLQAAAGRAIIPVDAQPLERRERSDTAIIKDILAAGDPSQNAGAGRLSPTAPRRRNSIEAIVAEGSQPQGIATRLAQLNLGQIADGHQQQLATKAKNGNGIGGI